MEKTHGLTAVVVGIDGYSRNPLTCAVNDAVSLAENLEKVWQGHHAVIDLRIRPRKEVLKAGESEKEALGADCPTDAARVTRKAILETVEKHARLAGPDDTFLFFFAGHGVLPDNQPVLMTVRNAETGRGFDRVKVSEIQEAASAAQGKKVMILDCCQERLKVDDNSYEYLGTLTQGWSILISCSPGEYSFEDQYRGESSDDYLQQGLFTAALVEGLRGEACDNRGAVNLVDLLRFVGKRVPIECRERKKGEPENLPEDTGPQNPVLLCEGLSMGGPYNTVMAPVLVPTSQRMRKKRPGKTFLSNWMNYLTRQWPVFFPLKRMYLLGGALLYAAVMMLTILWQYPETSLLFVFPVGLGSMLTWWIVPAFAVAANEERWHAGGYVTLLIFFAWHGCVTLGFALGTGGLSYLPFDLFLIFIVVVIFVCNPSQTIIAMAETIRNDERREIRLAIRMFQQYKTTMVGVDLYNFVAVLSARPDFYLRLLVVAGALLAFNTYDLVWGTEARGGTLWYLLIRNMAAMLMICWQVVWYHSAFKHIQHEVYRR